MTAKVSDYKNVLYSRNYSNDVRAQTNLVKRVALAALPFLSLHSSLRAPVSIIMGTFRVWNTATGERKDLFGLVVAVIAVSGSIFQLRVGMVVTTAHDVLIEIDKIRQGQSKEENAKSHIKIFSDITYLTLTVRGGLKLSILAFLMQAVVNLIQSHDEFKNGHWIEGVSNLLMTGVRAHQSYTQVQQLRRNWEIETSIKRISVGGLHERWRFPSDHLPVGVEVNGIRIISWNVLNNAFMDWVTIEDSQGVKDSMISELNVAVDKSGLTMRDVLVAEMVREMTDRGQVVALQECSMPFLAYLQEILPSSWGLVRSFPQRVDQDVIVYDKTSLTYQPERSEITKSAYPSVPGRPLQNAYFSSAERDFRIINCHIPGDPTQPGREEFARYVRGQYIGDSTLVAIGDNNFERDEMIRAYQAAGFSDFSIHSPWKTNTFREGADDFSSKAIDHCAVFGPP